MRALALPLLVLAGCPSQDEPKSLLTDSTVDSGEPPEDCFPEVPYDGLDNDCDPSTADDALDGDGWLLVDDCDDGDALQGGPEVAHVERRGPVRRPGNVEHVADAALVGHTGAGIPRVLVEGCSHAEVARRYGVSQSRIGPAGLLEEQLVQAPPDLLPGRLIRSPTPEGLLPGGRGSPITGRGLGTPYFMAPEQFRRAKYADARCDIYSLAATLYMCVTGQLPFETCGPLDAWMNPTKPLVRCIAA